MALKFCFVRFLFTFTWNIIYCNNGATLEKHSDTDERHFATLFISLNMTLTKSTRVKFSCGFHPPYFDGRSFAKHLHEEMWDELAYIYVFLSFDSTYTQTLAFQEKGTFQGPLGNCSDESHHITKQWWQNNLWIHWPFKTILFGICQWNQLTWRDNQRNESGWTHISSIDLTANIHWSVMIPGSY